MLWSPLNIQLDVSRKRKGNGLDSFLIQTDGKGKRKLSATMVVINIVHDIESTKVQRCRKFGREARPCKVFLRSAGLNL